MAPLRRQYGKERSLFIRRATSAFAKSKSISKDAQSSFTTKALSSYQDQACPSGRGRLASITKGYHFVIRGPGSQLGTAFDLPCFSTFKFFKSLRCHQEQCFTRHRDPDRRLCNDLAIDGDVLLRDGIDYQFWDS
jgi:hypothetical protein